jgi:predicted GIY-YIG superfamily endonuclease
VEQSYLYVISASTSGPCKLGRSNDPEKRLRQLQTGHSETLHLFHQELVTGSEISLMERALHRTIAFKRMRGEWFNITVEEAIAEVRHAVMLYTDNLKPKAASDKLADFDVFEHIVGKLLD